LPYCEEEWLKENYFHAILEITKSVAERLRQLSNYTSDGADLVDDCFGLGKDKKPMLAFNILQTPSDESEHKGFGNFCKGFFSMYRNPKAHNPKILAANSRLPQWGLTWLNQVQCFYQHLCLVDSEVLRNPPLRQAAKRCHCQKAKLEN
jgi:uncharacterized protein (TIGR02391 family)